MSNYYDTKHLKEGKFLGVPKAFFQKMRIQDAVYLSQLMMIAVYSKSDIRTTEDGWFKCSIKYMCKTLGITNSQERRMMERMNEMKLVERKMMGNPASRFIRLDVERIEKLRKPVPKKKIRVGKIRSV